jgi:hypothetical protein
MIGLLSGNLHAQLASVDQLPLFEDIRGKVRRVAGADVFRRVVELICTAAALAIRAHGPSLLLHGV